MSTVPLNVYSRWGDYTLNKTLSVFPSPTKHDTEHHINHTWASCFEKTTSFEP